MSKYRKIFHHVSSKDVRKKHQDNIAQLRIKEEKEIKILDLLFLIIGKVLKK